MRVFILIAAGLVAAGGTGFYLFSELVPARNDDSEVVTAQEPVFAEVYVPARSLPAGTILTADKLSRMKFGKDAVTPEMVVADEAGRDVLFGSVARQPLSKGVPISRSATVQPGNRGFLAAVLPQGKRAISIETADMVGLNGLMQPGDRVDIILTYSVAGVLIDAERDIMASETVMRGLRVIALDQRLESMGIDEIDGEIMTPPAAATATLEATPRQAEMIALAQSLGQLSLVLNSVEDGDYSIQAGAGETAAGDRLLGSMLKTVPLSGQGQVTDTPDIRAMTLDSDVTSLLQKHARETREKSAITNSPVPLEDRTASVQIVRGTSSNAVQLGAVEAGLAAGAGAPAVATE